MSWDPTGDGGTVLRGAYGLYFDQPLVGIFEQNSFTTPPVVNNVTFANARLGNPAAGQTPTTSGLRDDHRDQHRLRRIRAPCSGTSG